MSTRWSAEGWNDPVIEATRPPARTQRRAIIEAVAVWLALPAICWGALIAYLLGWLS